MPSAPLILNVIYAGGIDLVSWASWCRPKTLSCLAASSEQTLLAMHLESYTSFLFCDLSILQRMTMEIQFF